MPLLKPAARSTIDRWHGAAAALAMIGAVGLPGSAQAHVKWFTHTNVDTPPRPLSAVVTLPFLAILAIAIILVFFGYMIDGAIARRFPHLTSSGVTRASIEQRLVRAAAGGYFIAEAAVGGTILTPELVSHAPWVGITQFAIAFFLIWRRTCLLSGIGILLLYGDGILRYGAFHLTDYVFFPCLALYFASLTLPIGPIARRREPILTAGLAFSLAWTAIEKFLYPEWAARVVALHPGVAAGMPVPLMLTIAGFVEFTLAFYLVTGRGLLRLGGLGYLAIFVMAMPEFGRLDVFGHMIIIAILAITVLRGTTPMHTGLHAMRRRWAGPALVADAGCVVALYLATLAVFFAAYYAMQRS